jgi:HEPN domain-containing protein
MKPNQDEIKAWLQKARSDLFSAEILLDHDPPVPETAAFHCQQAVEKTLKALLVWLQIPFEKVHSLTYLLDLGEVECPGLTSLREDVEELTSYAVEIRYPGEVLEISPLEAGKALDTAQEVWRFVLDLLPTDLYLPLPGEEVDNQAVKG